MRIKVPNIEFINFNSGTCDIIHENENYEESYKFRKLGYSEKVLGVNRYYTAKAAQVKIDLVITIPLLQSVKYDDYVIIDKYKYSIELIQHKKDTNPKSIDLTLRRIGMHGG